MGLVPEHDRSRVAVAKAMANAANTSLRSRYARWDHPLPGIGRTIGRVSEARFERILEDYADETIFVHAGLGDVKRAFDRNPYTYLRDALFDTFDSILVPGFTPSFRESGIYHKQYSRPEYGAFAHQFLDDAEYRTDDAIHSILVRGDYRFPDRTHHDTFGLDGCWAQLDEDNVLYCNIGTPAIVSTQHHYIEHVADVPYNRTVDHDGVIYYGAHAYEHCQQRNYEYDLYARRSASKIQHDLREAGVLDHYDLEGLTLNFFRSREMREALEPKIAADPYYMIT